MVRIAHIMIFSLFSHWANACPAETARGRIEDEAKALNGQIEEITPFQDQSYQGVIRAQIQLWNGKVSDARFIVDIDRHCQVDIWKIPQP